MARTNAGTDLQAEAMGNPSADSGTATTAPTATTFTCDGKSYTTDQWKGHVVYRSTTYGVILSNTATVLTIDKWYNAASPGGAAASTPATGVYVIAPGNQPAFWMALTANAAALDATATVLTGEFAAAGGGLIRQTCAFAHTAGVASYTLTATFTANANDGASNTVNKFGVVQAQNGGRFLFITLEPNPPTLVSGDSVAQTEVVNI